MININRAEMFTLKRNIQAFKKLLEHNKNTDYKLKFFKERTFSQIEFFNRFFENGNNLKEAFNLLPNLKFIEESKELTSLQVEYMEKITSFVEIIEDLIDEVDLSDEGKQKMLKEYVKPLRNLSKENFSDINRQSDIEGYLYENIETDHIEGKFSFLFSLDTLKEKNYIEEYQLALGGSEEVFDDNILEEILFDTKEMVQQEDYTEEQNEEVYEELVCAMQGIMSGEVALYAIRFKDNESMIKVLKLFADNEMYDFNDIGLEIPGTNKLLEDKNIALVTYKSHMHDKYNHKLGSGLYEAFPLSIFRIEKLKEDIKKL